jgi:hypothetical protein
MSDEDEKCWRLLVRDLERYSGEQRTPRSLGHMTHYRATPEELAKFAAMRAEWLRLGGWPDWVRTFVDRQGTIMPDFDAIYRRKTELDP